MTDQQPPSADAFGQALADFLDTWRRAWQQIKPALAMLAEAAQEAQKADQDDYVLHTEAAALTNTED